MSTYDYKENEVNHTYSVITVCLSLDYLKSHPVLVLSLKLQFSDLSFELGF